MMTIRFKLHREPSFFSALLLGFVALSAAEPALAAGYTAIDLTPDRASSSANAIAAGAVGGFDVRVRVEANKGNKDKRFNYATLWNGTAISAQNIHPGGIFTHSVATALNGPWIVGYGADDTRIGTPAYYHAIVWDAAYQATDLNAFLPAPFVGSRASGVDERGIVSGYMVTATGQRHAVVWVPNS